MPRVNGRRVDVTTVAGGMQIHTEGHWWHVVEVVDTGANTGTRVVRARWVRGNGQYTAARPRLLWLPITRFGIPARSGRPTETSVGHGPDLRRAVLRPRFPTDPKPYIDAYGDRWGLRDTAAYRVVEHLADAFEAQVAL